MTNSYRCTLALPSRLGATLPSKLLPYLLAIVMLLGATRTASAEDPTVFQMPHEIKFSAMLVIDLTGDGEKEIIGGSADGYVTIIDGATYTPLWDKNMADYLPNYTKTRIQSGLATADLNHDGALDLVVATGGAEPLNADGPGALVVLTYRGAPNYFELMPGWPRFAFDELGNRDRPDGHPDGFMSTPSLGDIDGDGDMEIVIGGMDRRLHAFHHDGSYVSGWPLDRQYTISTPLGILRESRSTASLADLNGDGILDVIIGTNNYSIPACPNPYLLYAMQGDSTPLPGFPVETTQNIESAPAVGDITGDGSLDIVFGTGNGNESCDQPGGQDSDGKKVYAVDRFGQPLPGWPVKTDSDMPNSPALGDLDNDGIPEVVINSLNTLYAWHGDGTLVQGFPVHGEYHYRHTTPLLADVDGDSQVEIVLSTGQVYGPNGELEQHREKLQSLLVITDQDGDGLLETIGSNYYYIGDRHLRTYIYHETGPATGAQPWPTFHRSNDRTGVLPVSHTLTGRVVDESHSGAAGVTVKLNGGQIAVTDAQGNYVFGTLPPGNYTVTPTYQNYRFTPEQRTITLSANAVVDNFVMLEPFYDIQGKVLQANNSPLAGIDVRLGSGAIATTDANGRFAFEDQDPGQYTLTPVSPDLNYLPAQRNVIAEDEKIQFFYALPKPVIRVLEPNSNTEIEFMDTQGLPTRITFPMGLGQEEVVVTPVLAENPQGFLSAGHALELALSDAGNGTQSPVVGQDGEPLTLTIEIHYSEADLQSLLDAEELVLFWKSPDGWIEAQSACATGQAVVHNLSEKTLSTPVCQWGTYALVAPIDRLYMPILVSQQE